MRSPVLLAAPIALAACVPAARPPAPPPPPPAPVVALPPPPAAADWRDWPLTPGAWSYRRDGRGSVAVFGVGQLTLRCDPDQRRLSLSRAGMATTPLAVRTSTTARTLAVQPGAGAMAVLAPGDALLDAMAFSRGRFIVEQAGAPTLVVPAWPEIGRVIEDCRS